MSEKRLQIKVITELSIEALETEVNKFLSAIEEVSEIEYEFSCGLHRVCISYLAEKSKAGKETKRITKLSHKKYDRN